MNAADDSSQNGEGGQQRKQKRRGPPWYAWETDRVLEELGTDSERGLDKDEASRRLDEHGPNQLRQVEKRSAWAILIDQLKSLVIIILAVAAAVAAVLGDWPEAIAVAAVVLVNVAIGFTTEYRARQSMEALREKEERSTRVKRDGEVREIPVSEVVPGDILLLESGDTAPADVRILETEGLRVAEAALTGESVPVTKSPEPVAEDAVLAERTSMIYKGTTVSDGEGEGVVVATAMHTELGRIAELAQTAESMETPLQQRLDALGRRLAWITIGVAVALAVIGVLFTDKETRTLIETAIALGVAAIPEGLPVVATIALARGMHMMAARQALINRLTAVETLGATRIIFTDKTGTLTENRMTLRRVVSPEGDITLGDDGEEPDGDEYPLIRRIVEVGVLCNGARLAGDDEDDEDQGDPTELALLKGGRCFDLRRPGLLEQQPEVREEPFSSETMRMATFHESADDGELLVAVKGSPSRVLEVCDRVAGTDGEDQTLDDEGRQRWMQRVEDLAGEGLRLLAMAEKTVQSRDEEPYESLRFLGLVGLLDPPREDVKAAIEDCRRAGIRVIMVTGDQPATAAAIGRAVSLTGDREPRALHGKEIRDPEEMSEKDRERIHEADIFARVSPEQKLNLVTVFQEKGEAVAMTGDGINDAPALKKAEIGIAMGQRGTEAARQVADMILTNDAFASIVAAVRHGRIIFGNIRQSVMFMLCTNVAEVIAVAVAFVIGAFVALPIPLKPLQILYLNVLTDVFPALALGVGRGSPGVMKRDPRPPGEDIITRRHWLLIGGWGVVIATCVLGALAAALNWLGMEQQAAVTVSFLTLGFTKLWFVFNLRDRRSGFIRNEVTTNPYVWGAIALCVALLIAAAYLPGLTGILATRNPGLQGWALILGVSLLPLLIGQVLYLTVWKTQADG